MGYDSTDVRTPTQLLADAARRVPDATAVRDAAGSWTYAELERRAAAAAQWLDEHGVGHGDRVVLRLGNVREFVAVLFGAFRIGAVAVPINPAMRPYQVAQVVADCEPALVVTGPDDPLRETPQVGDLTATPPDLSMPAEPPASKPVLPDDLGLLIYTSGSTSTPKAVMSPHRCIGFATAAIGARLGYRADDVVLVALPLSFDYGLYQVFLAVAAGAQLVLSGADDHVGLLPTITRSGATVVPVVPSLARMLLVLSRRGGHDGTVRLFTNTGAALLPGLIAELRQAFPGARVAPMYGITECKRVTILDPELVDAKPGSAGRALPGTEVEIADDSGRPLPAGEIGEIVVRGPHVMAGYWRAPELTARRYRMDERGVVTLHTGDYGHLDADGHLYFAGRRDDMFKRHGIRMGGLEIEAAAMDVAGVRAAALVTPTDGHDMTLFVVSEVDAEVVRAGLADRLERAKVPPVCLRLDALPLTANGKTDYRALRARLTK